MTTLSEFLLARIAEDEAVARDAIGEARPDWVVGCEETGDGENAFWAVEALGEKSEWFADLGSQPSDHARAAHIARHDPARVLTECEAKRRIVEHHAPHRGDDEFPLCAICTELGPEAQGWPCLTLRLLALPYAGHSDYDEEWRT